MSIVIVYGFHISLKTPETIVCHTIESNDIVYGTDWTDINMRRHLPQDSPEHMTGEEFEAEIRKIGVKALFPIDTPFFVSESPDSHITFFKLSMYEIVVGLPILRSSTETPFLVEENQKDEFYNHWRHFRSRMPRTSNALSDECGVPKFYYIETI